MWNVMSEVAFLWAYRSKHFVNHPTLLFYFAEFKPTIALLLEGNGKFFCRIVYSFFNSVAFNILNKDDRATIKSLFRFPCLVRDTQPPVDFYIEMLVPNLQKGCRRTRI